MKEKLHTRSYVIRLNDFQVLLLLKLINEEIKNLDNATIETQIILENLGVMKQRIIKAIKNQ